MGHGQRTMLLWVVSACGRLGFSGGDCPNTHGPAMARVPGDFCVDTAEVSKAQYDEFLQSLPAVATDGDCSFNTTYQAVDYVWNATTDPDQAVAGINWCDARDYCTWAGKRLCGAIGGGSLAYADHASPSSQWYFACSQGVGRHHPYGTVADDTAKVGYCHLDDPNTAPGAQAVVASYPDCVLAGTEVRDLLGNVEEWIDACEPGGLAPGTSHCKVMGGTWFFAASYSDCDFFDPAGGPGVARNAREKMVGFRCCAD